MAAGGAGTDSFARRRLVEERKLFRKNRKFGFFARPRKNTDGTADMMNWECGIPGKAGTPWEGGIYKLVLTFHDSYPASPPICKFTPPLFHPNVYPSGRVCLSVLDQEKGWNPLMSIQSILESVQELLTEPNLDDPAQSAAFELARDNPTEYNKRIAELATKYKAP